MSEVVYYTEEGLEKLKVDLDQLKSVERPNVARQIAEARDKGDLSENAEYTQITDPVSILQLYKDLVITNIITPEEFWSQHAPSKNKSSSDSSSNKQEVGVAGSFLAEIKPQADGANGIR